MSDVKPSVFDESTVREQSSDEEDLEGVMIYPKSVFGKLQVLLVNK